jgi:hypothetical protein
MVTRHSGAPPRCISIRAGFFATAIFWIAVAPSLAPAQATAQDGPLQSSGDLPRAHFVDNDTILRMHKAGLGDDVILQTIRMQPGHYDTAPDTLIALKSAGLSDKVIAAMQAHGAAPAIHDPERATLRDRDGLDTPPAEGLSTADLPPGVNEIGVYFKTTRGPLAGQWQPLRTERVVFRSGGAVKSALTQGILAKDMYGHIEGAKSPQVLPNGFELLIYAPAGTDGNEYDLLRLRDHKTYREFRVLGGGVLHSTSGPGPDEVDFSPKKIAAQLYTFTVPNDIEKGEYGILPPGSANQRGFADTGKIFTFSIIE